MLQAINYEDMGVVDEFMGGTSFVGSAPTTGLWPAKFTPATMSVSELHELPDERDRKVSEQLKWTLLWRKRCVSRRWLRYSGFLIGHIELDHIPLSKRFGIKQGAKTRCVDDSSRSGINS